MVHNLQSLSDDHDVAVRRYDAADGDAIAVDFGPGRSPTVDVLGDTAIVVFDDDDQQVEFDLPAANADTFITNGVLTIEVSE
jgi:hypothetical protein